MLLGATLYSHTSEEREKQMEQKRDREENRALMTIEEAFTEISRIIEERNTGPKRILELLEFPFTHQTLPALFDWKETCRALMINPILEEGNTALRRIPEEQNTALERSLELNRILEERYAELNRILEEENTVLKLDLELQGELQHARARTERFGLLKPLFISPLKSNPQENDQMEQLGKQTEQMRDRWSEELEELEKQIEQKRERYAELERFLEALRFSTRIDTYSRLGSQQRQSSSGQKGLRFSTRIDTYSRLRSQKCQRQKGLRCSTRIDTYSRLKSQKRQNPDDDGQKELQFSESNTLKRNRPDDRRTNDDSLEHNSSEESEEESECGSVDNEKGYYFPEQQRKDMKQMMNSNEYIDAMKSVKAGKECADKLQEK